MGSTREQPQRESASPPRPRGTAEALVAGARAAEALGAITAVRAVLAALSILGWVIFSASNTRRRKRLTWCVMLICSATLRFPGKGAGAVSRNPRRSSCSRTSVLGTRTGAKLSALCRLQCRAQGCVTRTSRDLVVVIPEHRGRTQRRG